MSVFSLWTIWRCFAAGWWRLNMTDSLSELHCRWIHTLGDWMSSSLTLRSWQKGVILQRERLLPSWWRPALVTCSHPQLWITLRCHNKRHVGWRKVTVAAVNTLCLVARSWKYFAGTQDVMQLMFPAETRHLYGTNRGRAGWLVKKGLPHSETSTGKTGSRKLFTSHHQENMRDDHWKPTLTQFSSFVVRSVERLHPLNHIWRSGWSVAAEATRLWHVELCSFCSAALQYFRTCETAAKPECQGVFSYLLLRIDSMFLIITWENMRVSLWHTASVLSAWYFKTF